MRIIMIGQKGLPAHSGGIERHVDDLATRLAGAGHEVIAYCRKSYTLNYNFVKEYRGVRLIYIPTFRSKHFETMINTFFASLHALFLRADIIHYHGIGPSLFAWIPRIFAPRCKVIATFHCQDYFHQKWGAIARCVFRAGEYVACRWTHKTIAVSKLLRRLIKQRYGRDALYIPNAVTIPNRVMPNKIKRYGLERGSYLLCVSRLVKHKGVHYIIDAHNTLVQKMKHPIKLVVVGAGSYTDAYVQSLKERAKRNKHIIFTGELSGNILGELYSNARLYIQASESEGLSISLLEAMSYGCPVLVSDIAENREVLPVVGYTFKNKNVEDLLFNMWTILHSKHSAYQLQREIKHVKEHYNFDAVFKKSLQLYRQQVEA